MSLLKVTSLNSIAVAVRLLTSLGLNKILAIYIGPSGYAVVAQFQNLVSIIASLGGNIFTTGVIQATARLDGKEIEQQNIWRTVIKASLISCFMIAATVAVFKSQISKIAFGDSSYSTILFFLAICLPAVVVNNIFLAIINGKKNITALVYSNVAGSIITLILAGGMAVAYGIDGVLIAIVVSPVLVLFCTTRLIYRENWFSKSAFWGRVEKQAFRELSKFALMGLVSAISVPLTTMLIRGLLIENFNIESAGYWQAIWKISDIYLMVITATLSSYYLPRLSEIESGKELKHEILKVYKYVMPIVILLAITMFIFRYQIVSLLFDDSFFPMLQLLPWQLVGDVIKIASWILGFVMVGRAMAKQFILTEMLFSATFVYLSYVFTDIYGLVGVSIAYALNFIIHWCAMFMLVKREIRNFYVERLFTP